MPPNLEAKQSEEKISEKDLNKESTDSIKKDKDMLNATEAGEKFKSNTRERISKVEKIAMKEDLKNQMNDPDFYKNVTDAYIAKKYPGDADLVQYLKDNISLDGGSQKAIKQYFEYGLDGKGTDFSIAKLEAFSKKNYSPIQITGEDKNNKLNIDGLEPLEIIYKRDQLKKSIKDTIEDQLKIYPFDADTKDGIMKSIDKVVQNYADTDVKRFYQEYKKTEREFFKKEIINNLNELVAEQNRKYLLQEFKTINTDENEWKKFETMLNKTKGKDINPLASALTYPGQNPKILNDLRAKVKARNDNEKILFTGAKINVAATEADIAKIEESKDTASKYTIPLEARKESDSIGETAKTALGDSINVLKNKQGVVSISIQIPEGNQLIENQVGEVLKGANTDGRVSLIKVKGLNSIKIISKEKEEMPPEKIHISLEKLESDMIGDAAKIKTALLSADKSNILQDMLNNPDTTPYKIVGASVYASASKQISHRQGNENLQHYKNGDNEKPKNVTISNKIKDSTTQQLQDTQQSDQINSVGLTMNPTLSRDRGAAILDYLIANNKNTANAKYALNYGVNGPTVKELTDKLSKTKDLTPVNQAFKEWQYVDADIDVVKSQIVQHEKDIPITKALTATGFEINIIGESLKTIHSDGGNGGKGGTWDFLPSIISTSRSKKFGSVSCPTF